MARWIKEYRVFIATPGGLEKVRRAFTGELHKHNEMDAIRRGVLFTPVGWEETLGGVQRPQSLINQELVQCDYFVLVLYDRWGSPPDIEGRFTSGCEEELNLALKCHHDSSYPMKEVVILFKAVEPRRLVDPGPQLKKVLAFKRQLEESRQHLFMTFDQSSLFRRTLRRYLARWVHAHEEGTHNRAAFEIVSGPDLDSDYGRISTNAELDEAERLADRGRFTDAETIFARAVSSGSDPEALTRYGNYLRRRGRISQAETMYRKLLEQATSYGEQWRVEGYVNLGLIERHRGRLGAAEKHLQKAMEISRQLNFLEGIAKAYGHLGLIYRRRGLLDLAESMVKEALKIYKDLGDRRAMADAYGSLGLLYRRQGKIELAEETHLQALEISNKIDYSAGALNAYGNLALICRRQGDLNRAENFHRRGLGLSEKLGNVEGMAVHCSNLGLIYKSQGDYPKAIEFWTRARDLYAELGAFTMVEEVERRIEVLT